MPVNVTDVLNGTKMCKRGHVYAADRPACTVCLYARVKKWKLANREKVLLQERKYNKATSEKYHSIRKAWRIAHPEKDLWHGMINRCMNPKNAAYVYYGARGITVCDRWLGEQGFENFFADMGKRPSPELTIERNNNNLGYSPQNCRWATQAEQSRNNRKTNLIIYDGKTLCLTDWAAKIGIPYAALRSRIRLGWPVEKALTMPQQHQNRNLSKKVR